MDSTITFTKLDDRETDYRAILKFVYSALVEKGYDPINQLVGYVLSEDPTYITTHKNARAMIQKVDRDELLQHMISYYLGKN